MIRNRRPAAAAAAIVVFAAAGVCGVVAARLVRAAWETLVQQTSVQTAPADAEGGAPAHFTTTVTSSVYSLQVEVDPARLGSSLIHLYAFAPDKTPLPVVEWQGTAGLPEKGIEPVAIPLLALTGNQAIGEVRLTAPGDWQLHFTVRTSDIDQTTVSVTVPVSQESTGRAR